MPPVRRRYTTRRSSSLLSLSTRPRFTRLFILDVTVGFVTLASSASLETVQVPSSAMMFM
ncbi:MAG: hypothetical protein Q4Q58_00480 [Thermoplasmata archaeon]|nr:hypothetical protein [Thermoplasmata archaeon]